MQYIIQNPFSRFPYLSPVLLLFLNIPPFLLPFLILLLFSPKITILAKASILSLVSPCILPQTSNIKTLFSNHNPHPITHPLSLIFIFFFRKNSPPSKRFSQNKIQSIKSTSNERLTLSLQLQILYKLAPKIIIHFRMNHLQRNLFVCIQLLGTILLHLLTEYLYPEFSWLKLPLLFRFSLIVSEHLILAYFLYELDLKDQQLEIAIKMNLKQKISNFFIWTVFQANYFYLTCTIQFQHCDFKNKLISNAWFKFVNFKIIGDHIAFYLLVFFVIRRKICQWRKNSRRRKELEELVIITKYSSKEYPDKNDCSICLVSYKENEDISKIACSHNFHIACLFKWIEVNITCPICRGLIL